MISNCQGCEHEMEQAFLLQSIGVDIALEGMDDGRKHCLFYIVRDEESFK